MVEPTITPAQPSGVSQPVAGAPGKFHSFFNHPAIRIVERLAALAAIPLAVLLYLAGVHKPQLSYYLHSTRGSIVSAGSDPLLQVSYAGQQVRENLTAVQFAIWNAGNAPIRSGDILQAPMLTIEPPARLLNAKVMELTRSLTGFRIDDSKKTEGQLSFGWTILEEGDGAKVQLLFEGAPEAKLKVSGEIVGQPGGVQEFKVKEKAPAVEDWRKRKVVTWVLMIFVAGTGTCLPWALEDNFSGGSARARRIARRIGWLLALGAYVGTAWMLFALAVDYSLPFKF